MIAAWALVNLTQKFSGTVTNGGATIVVTRSTDRTSAGDGGGSDRRPVIRAG
jgi:hypothetical protein